MKKLILIIFLFTAISYSQNNPLSLDESIQIGLKNSKDLIISKSKTRYADAKITEVASQMLPQLQFSASYARLSDITPFEVSVPFYPQPIKIQDPLLNNYNLKLSLSQPLFTGFRLSSLKSAAEYNFDASTSDYNAAINNYALQIQEAFWNFYNAQKIVDLIKEQKVSVNKHLDDTKNFMDNGLATMNDVLKLQVQLSNIELQLIDAENNRDLARINFNKAIGYDLNSETEIQADSINPIINEASLDELIKEAKLKRDEVNSLEKRVLASDKAITAANSNWFPNVFLFGDVYYSNPNQRIMPQKDKFTETWDVGVSLNWSLWNWGYTSSQSNQAKELKLQTETSLSKLRDAIEIEVTSEYLNYNKSLKKVEVAKTSVEQAEENYRLTEDKYNQQLASSSDLIDAETYLLEAKTNLTSALVNYQLSKVRLDRSIGKKIY
jgi:outer membrane protein TolC